MVLEGLVVLSLLSLSTGHQTYVSTGNSKQYSSQDSLGNYEFGYNEGHSSGGTFRKETSDAYGNKYGSYGLRDADGRYRVVNYVADAAGFRASVQTNEPGVAPDDPASTTINKLAIPVVTVDKTTVPVVPVVSKTTFQAISPYKKSSYPVAAVPVGKTSIPVIQALSKTSVPVVQMVDPFIEKHFKVHHAARKSSIPVVQTVEPVSKTSFPVAQTVSKASVPVVQTFEPVSKTSFATVPVSKTHIPVVQAVEPVIKTFPVATVPVSKTHIPIVQAVEPVIKTSYPVVQTTVPVSKTSFPVAQVAEPFSKTSVAQTTIPVVTAHKTSGPVVSLSNPLFYPPSSIYSTYPYISSVYNYPTYGHYKGSPYASYYTTYKGTPYSKYGYYNIYP